MFGVVEKHQKVVKGILIAITATFVVWGISGYLGMSGDDGYIAKVGDKKIYQADIDNATDPSQGKQDSMQILFGLINRQLLINNLQDHHMTATDEQLRQVISQIPAFQTNGKFDTTKYQEFLKQQYMTPEKFQNSMSQQVVIEQMLDFFKKSYFTANKLESQLVNLLSRERQVSQYVINTNQFLPKINISESDVTSYYQQHIQDYTVPEEVKLQYLQLSQNDAMKNIQISESELTNYINSHGDSLVNKEVDVSHILFSVPNNATAEQKAQIKAKAEQILAQVKANPDQFATLAKQYSQDPGSAEKGGDLGFFGKGVMVPAFESVAFNLQKGQISNLVETQFGYHILKLNAIRGVDSDSIKASATQILQKQKSQQQMQTMVEQLNDLTYNSPDSLTVAAQKLNLTIQNSDWIYKNESGTLLANPKLVQAVFTNDVLKSHHNSEVVDMGDGSYVVARVSDYRATTTKPLSVVRDGILVKLKQSQANQMAIATGQQDLQSLQAGKLKLDFTNSGAVSLLGQNSNFDAQAIQQIFAAPKTFPSYAGSVDKNGNFVIYQVTAEKVDPKLLAENSKMLQLFSQQNSNMTLNAYVSSLRSDYDVSYKLDRIKKTGDDTTDAPQQ